MDLEKYLKEYKALTLDIMEQINIDGDIEFLLNERQIILNKINSLKYNQSDLIKIAESLKLINLENEMNMLVKSEMINIKNKLKNLKKNQAGNQHYLNSFQFGYNGYAKFDKLF